MDARSFRDPLAVRAALGLDGEFAVGAHVKLLCRGTDERSAIVAALFRL